jgi:hypothetical protein
MKTTGLNFFNSNSSNNIDTNLSIYTLSSYGKKGILRSTTEWPGIVVHGYAHRCQPRYSGSRGRRKSSKCGLGIKSMRLYLKTKLKKQKDWGAWFKWQSDYKALSSNSSTAKTNKH